LVEILYIICKDWGSNPQHSDSPHLRRVSTSLVATLPKTKPEEDI